MLPLLLIFPLPLRLFSSSPQSPSLHPLVWIREMLLLVEKIQLLQSLMQSLASYQKKPSYMPSLWHKLSHPTQVSTASVSETKGQEGAAKESYIRHSTSKDASSSTASAAIAEICSCQTEWQAQQIKAFQEEAARA